MTWPWVLLMVVSALAVGVGVGAVAAGWERRFLMHKIMVQRERLVARIEALEADLVAELGVERDGRGVDT